MSSLRNRKGIALIAAIFTIVIASIVVLSTTVFVVEKLSLVSTKRFRIRTIELAQAGIEASIFTYRVTDFLPTYQAQLWLIPLSMDADNSFVMGGTDADMLMVDTSTSSISPLSGPREAIADFRLKNATSTRAIDIDQLVIHWDNAARLRFVVLDGQVTSAGGDQRSPATIDLTPDFTLDTVPTTYGGNFFIFSNSMAGSTVNVNFIMTNDATSKALDIYPAANKFNFTLRATGRTANSNIQRTISAEYNSLTSRIEDYREIDTHFTP